VVEGELELARAQRSPRLREPVVAEGEQERVPAPEVKEGLAPVGVRARVHVLVLALEEVEEAGGGPASATCAW